MEEIEVGGDVEEGGLITEMTTTTSSMSGFSVRKF